MKSRQLILSVLLVSLLSLPLGAAHADAKSLSHAVIHVRPALGTVINAEATWYRTPHRMGHFAIASNVLPIGTWVHLCHIETGLCADAVVRDEGPNAPQYPKRKFDLGYDTAELVGLIMPGVGHVRVEVIQ